MARHRQRKAPPREPVELDIEKLSHEGRGIAHRDGKVLFVTGALPGERVRAVLTSRRGRFDEARVEEVLAAAPERVEPKCGYAAICGGCSLQHYGAAAQLTFKAEVLHEKLRHSIGREDYEKLPPLTGPAFHYRRKARLAVRYVPAKESVLVGFREKGSSFITQMDSCETLAPEAARLLPALGPLIHSLRVYRHIPQIEVAVGDAHEQARQVALVVRHLQELPEQDFARLREFADEHAVDIYLQAGGLDSITRFHPPAGPDRLYYELPGHELSMAFHPVDFTQVNAGINSRMIDLALELLAPQADERILDLFCGLGNFTLPLARRAREVVGVEGVDEMVARGHENAARNGIGNAAFHRADLSRPMTGEDWFAGGFDKVLLDPPRSGALEVLADVAACRPRRIVYISCNPATLARDAGELEALGYRLRCAGVMDMFPQTTHVESIALFEPA